MAKSKTRSLIIKDDRWKLQTEISALNKYSSTILKIDFYLYTKNVSASCFTFCH